MPPRREYCARCRLPRIDLEESLGPGNGKVSMRYSVKETHRLYEQLSRLVVPIPRLEGCDISRSADPRQMGPAIQSGAGIRCPSIYLRLTGC